MHGGGVLAQGETMLRQYIIMAQRIENSELVDDSRSGLQRCFSTAPALSQLMLLLPRCDLPELLLWNTTHEPFQTSKDFHDTHTIQRIPRWHTNQLLYLQQAVLVQVIAETIIDLPQHRLEELLIILASINNLVHKSNVQQLLCSNSLAHDERLVRLANTESLNEANTGSTFCNETERGKRRQQESVRHSVNEITEGNQCCGEANSRTIQRCYEDFWMRVECMGDVKVVGDKVAEPLSAKI